MSIDYAGFRHELESFVRDACPPEIRAVVAAGQKITKREYQAPAGTSASASSSRR